MAQNGLSKRDKIIIRGARVNNLKNIDVEIPRDKLVVITGLSGSGKSSLAFDVIYAEGNRRYLEGMSIYARQFLDISAKSDVDKIENLSPTISIDQRSVGRSPRSTVGTLTEIYDYLRVLFSKAGSPYCPGCGALMFRKSNREILEEIMSLPGNTNLAILAKVRERDKSSREILKSVGQLGYARVRLNGKIHTVEQAMLVASDKIENQIEVVIDRVVLNEKNPDKERIFDSIETALKIGNGFFIVSRDNKKDIFFNRDFVCHECYFKINEITPKNFSFNSPEGACPSCSGLGIIREINEELVIPNKKLSLSEGAIMPWSKSVGRMGGKNGQLQILKILGEKYGFSIEDPVKDITPENLRIIFYGTKKEEVAVQKTSDLGGIVGGKIYFDGVIPMLKRKYEEASSDFLRGEIEKYMLEKVCPACEGKRLKSEFLSVLIGEKSIDDVVNLNFIKLKEFLSGVDKNIENPSKKEVIKPLLKEMLFRTEALSNVGLEYLTLSRRTDSISGGEGQRIRLATQIGSDLMGLIYILDEPSVGLHNRDTEKLINTMKILRESGNSLIVVEHDEKIMREADWIIDMGPGAGEEGGKVIFEGTIEKLLKSKNLTAQYLNGKRKVFEKNKYNKGNGKNLEIIGAIEHNLKDIDVKIPLGKLVSVTGVSGSGKSTLVNGILAVALSKYFFRAKKIPGKHKKIKGMENIDKVISIDQAPIGRTPRSNAATYTGVFSLIRDLFSETEEAKKRGYMPSRFSFNMRGGRCESCQGDGTKKIEMYLLPDMYVKCESCGGTRYNRGTLEIEYQGVNISDVLNMSVSYALRFFKKSPLIVEKLRTLENVGLGYLKLGQSATSLSGGEAQRIKLATELSRKQTGKTLYILDEPTIGLHFEDIKKLLNVLDTLVQKGNSVLVVEHNMDVIRASDWVVDLGPEGGDKGGEIVYAGSPDKLKKCKRSWTARYI
jgi:excinuclease ABC subunit A